MKFRRIIALISTIGLGTTGIAQAASGADAVLARSRVLAPISSRFASLDSSETPSFRRHVVPLLGKLGCNGRACHGSFQGRGGFHLSLFGYDFKMDHEALLAGDEPRANPRDPETSLILQKPTLKIPHEGGRRYQLGSWEHHVLLRWIQKGALGIGGNDAKLTRLEVSPAEIAFARPGEHVALKAVVHWSDGTTEDVTPLCRFQSNDEQVAAIDPHGRVTSAGTGDSHVVVFYDSAVVPVTVLRPVSPIAVSGYPDVPVPTEIDRLVVQKLRKLGIVPSELCTDAEFLRRVSLDMTGTLPPPSEVAAFLADQSPEKRRRKVDELLERPTYAAWWTTKLCDITGNSDGALNNVTPIDQRGSQEWYDWILRRVRENVPYDKLVEGIVLATGRRPGQSYAEYAQEMTDMARPGAKHTFADRPGLSHFWARRTVVQPQQKALSFAYTFLGIRIQCAECHKHPFDQWTQDDYKDFTKFFTRVRFGVSPSSRSDHEAILASIQAGTKRGNDLRREFPRLLAEGKTLPVDEVFVEPVPPRRGPQPRKRPLPSKALPSPPSKPKAVTSAKQTVAASPKAVSPSKDSGTNPARKPVVAKRPVEKRRMARKGAGKPGVKPSPARLLGGEAVDLSRYEDPRIPLMKWLRSSQNHLFARAFVNRIWAAYFNVGIVNPPDNLSLANPASNAELLDYLANSFVAHAYDMKWLHREIVNSRTYQLSWRQNATNRLDERNFSHAILRRLPAEVAYDAVRQATASDATTARMQTDCSDRAIAVAGSGRRGRGGSLYALSVFGRSVRETNCDCDRSNDPSLLQTVFLRNDVEVQAMLNNPRTGWIAQIAAEHQPKRSPAAKKSNPRRLPEKPLPKSDSASPKPTVSASQSVATDSKTLMRTPVIAQRPRPKRAAAKRIGVKQPAAPVLPSISLSREQETELVRSAYLRTLSRYPDEQETARAVSYLDEPKNTLKSVRDLMWALVNTQEFIVNH